MTPWTIACQASLSMGCPRQEYWSGLLFPSPEDLPDPGAELGSPALQVVSLSTKPPIKLSSCSTLDYLMELFLLAHVPHHRYSFRAPVAVATLIFTVGNEA